MFPPRLDVITNCGAGGWSHRTSAVMAGLADRQRYGCNESDYDTPGWEAGVIERGKIGRVFTMVMVVWVSFQVVGATATNGLNGLSVKKKRLNLPTSSTLEFHKMG